ncbi:MAG: FHA domain-containing protein [Planctomycetes bacterium]|nr:FHA domain-containing protein [Planctomycetota bacterium]
MRYLIVKKENSQKALQFKIVAPVITIGRTSENSIALKDSSVSRQHCVIETSNNITRIRDVGSFHGFLINDKQSRKAVLKHGDCVKIGSYEVYYIIKDEEETTTTMDDQSPVTVHDDSETVQETKARTDSSEAILSQLQAIRQPDEGQLIHSPDEEAQLDENPLPVEMRTGDFPTGDDNKRSESEAHDEMDLNRQVSSSPTPPTKPTKAKKGRPPSSPPPTPQPQPHKEAEIKQPPPQPSRVSQTKTEQKLIDAEATISQLQSEFGDLLKRFEANKAQLGTFTEQLESEQLRASSVAKRHKHASEKNEGLESKLLESLDTIKSMEEEAMQAHREYHDLDEKFQALEQERDSALSSLEFIEAELHAAISARDDFQKQVTSMMNTKDDLESKVSQFQAQFSVARKKIASLETNLNTVQESRMRAKNVATTLERERNELKTSLEASEEECEKFKSRSSQLETLLNESLQDQTTAESKIAEVRKSGIEHHLEIQKFQAELNDAHDRISELEDELEQSGDQVKQASISTIASDAATAVKGGVIDVDKIKRKLGAMEKERRSAVAYAERAQKQLAVAQQQSVVLQSFLDEREALIKKLREKLKDAGGSETVAD